MKTTRYEFIGLILTLSVLIIFSHSICYAGNGIEGKIESYASQPKKSISIIAETETDIKEELSRAQKITKTNKDGVFNFNNLLPNKRYRIRVNDKKYISKTIYVIAPEKGTRLAKETLLYTLLPAKRGVWFYDLKQSKFTNIYVGHKPVMIRSHSGVGGSGGLGRSNLSAFSVDSTNIFKPFLARKKGYIFILNDSIEDFASLHKISNSGSSSIPDGYYYNIRKFYGDNFKALYDKPNISNRLSFNDRGRNLSCFNLSNLNRGLYIIATRIEKQNMSRILGGERAPREGYLLHVTEGDEYTANLLLKKKEYNSSIKIFKKLLKKQPNDLILLEGLYFAYSKSNQNEQAIETADKLLQINPSSSLYYELGELNLKTGNKKKAIDNLKKALLIDLYSEEIKNKLSTVLNKPINTIIQNDKSLKLAFYEREFEENKDKGIPIHLQSHKIAAYINFNSEKGSKLYPANYESFIVESERDGSDFKLPKGWDNIGYKKTGIYFIKGGKTEQTIYINVDPLQIEFTDGVLNEFIAKVIRKKYGNGVRLHLQPHKIAAYINFTSEKSSKLYPANYESFIVESERDGSDFKVPKGWPNIGYKKTGKYFVKGNDTEQFIYLAIDPSQVNIIEQ